MTRPDAPHQPAPGRAQDLSVPVIVFKLRDEVYAIPVSQVREVLRFQEILPLPEAPAFIEGVINRRGRVVAVIDLCKRLGLGESTRNESQRIIIVRLTTTFVGILADGVESILDVPSAAIQQAPEVVASYATGRYLSGIIRLGERLILFLNLSAVFSTEETQQVAAIPARP